MRTEAFDKFKNLIDFLYCHSFSHISRAAFFRLPPGERVLTHIDDGDYYLNKDRFHLSIQGEYLYTVDDESKVIKPGTLFWFDNKKQHSAHNISEIDRITLVFDIPHKHSPIRDENNNLNFEWN